MVTDQEGHGDAVRPGQGDVGEGEEDDGQPEDGPLAHGAPGGAQIAQDAGPAFPRVGGRGGATERPNRGSSSAAARKKERALRAKANGVPPQATRAAPSPGPNTRPALLLRPVSALALGSTGAG